MFNFLRKAQLRPLVRAKLKPHDDRLTSVVIRLRDLEFQFFQSWPEEFQYVEDIEERLFYIEEWLEDVENRLMHLKTGQMSDGESYSNKTGL